MLKMLYRTHARFCMVTGPYALGKSDASLGGVNMHLKSMSRCSWVVVGPSSSGPIVPRTV